MTSPDSDRPPVSVVKVGGAHLGDPDFVHALVDYLVARREEGAALVLVHGGGKGIAELHESLGLPYRKVRGLRVTSTESMPLVTMVLRGLLNTRLVGNLVGRGVPALGLSGVDLGLMETEFLNATELGRVGGPPDIRTAFLDDLLGKGVLPVLCPICLGPDGGPVNVNADTVAHSLAVALQAEGLEFVSDVPGVRGDDGILSTIRAPQVPELLDAEVISGGMIPKMQAALAALSSGVQTIRIGDLSTLQTRRATEVHA